MNNIKTSPHLISVAPMMDWTDRHCRYFLRLISKRTLLYTEMITTGAIIYGDRHRFLQFDESEYPLALQLGGSDPHALAQCAKIAEHYHYNEINLNIGCPSDRVQSGMFGACLMKQPQLVADCIKAMQDSTSLPVTVKTRIGVDEFDSYEFLTHFIETVAKTGCQTFVVHARKAWLKGLSPKQNREIPPLHYDTVSQLKKDFPRLEIIVNGGIKTKDLMRELLTQVDGVMIGREAYQHPYFLADVDQVFYGDSENIKTREEIVDAFLPYLETQLKQGVPLQAMTRHILGLFHGEPGAKHWRRYISQNAYKKDSGTDVIKQAMKATFQLRDEL